MFITRQAIEALEGFGGNAPFDHVVIDDFFTCDLARRLEAEFPAFDDPLWHLYDNAIEVKKVCNLWNHFPQATYQVFSWFNSPEFVDLLGSRLGIAGLASDPGLNGGGWHAHARGGKLNTHLDYSLHPKLGLQRKLNLIVYLNSEWQDEWGGELGLWRHDAAAGQPGELVTSIAPRFNRAVLFDTTQNSWHGLPAPLACPQGQLRKSLAVYYLVPAPDDVDPRGKALFAPTAEQKGDPEVEALIKARADVATAAKVYRKR